MAREKDLRSACGHSLGIDPEFIKEVSVMNEDKENREVTFRVVICLTVSPDVETFVEVWKR